MHLIVSAIQARDYYGRALNVNDKDIVQFERMMCARQQMNDYDTSE